MRLYKSTKQLYHNVYAMHIKLLHTYSISKEYLQMVYIISLKNILYISQAINFLTGCKSHFNPIFIICFSHAKLHIIP